MLSKPPRGTSPTPACSVSEGPADPVLRVGHPPRAVVISTATATRPPFHRATAGLGALLLLPQRH